MMAPASNTISRFHNLSADRELEGTLDTLSTIPKIRLRADCGIDAAEAANSAAMDAISELRDRIVETPAKTLAGLIFKSKYAAEHYPGKYDQDSWTRSWTTCSRLARRSDE
jgi:hypothetical protein